MSAGSCPKQGLQALPWVVGKGGACIQGSAPAPRVVLSGEGKEFLWACVLLPIHPSPTQGFPGPSTKRNAPLLQFRGGPQKYEVTGWLQIQGVRVTDEGTYRCFARNRVGEVVALASLTVFTPGEHHVFVPTLSWGRGRGCLGRVNWCGGSCWSIGLCWGCPSKLLCTVWLWGRGQALRGGNVTLSPHCRFRPAQPDRFFPAKAPHDA